MTNLDKAAGTRLEAGVVVDTCLSWLTIRQDREVRLECKSSLSLQAEAWLSGTQGALGKYSQRQAFPEVLSYKPQPSAAALIQPLKRGREKDSLILAQEFNQGQPGQMAKILSQR